MNESSLKQLLAQHDADTQTKILKILQATGIAQDDPIFLLLLATSTLQVLLVSAPQELKQTYEYCHQQVIQHLEQYEKAACRGIEEKVATTVDRLLQQAAETTVAQGKEKQAKLDRPSFLHALKDGTHWLLICTGAVLTVFSAGIFCGWGWSEHRQAQQAPQVTAGPHTLTLTQAEALNWATSREGRYAKQLMAWNDSLVGGECQQQVKRLNIALTYMEKKATSGFCFLWVVPPKQRGFK